MLFSAGWRSLGKRVRGCSPFAGRFLPREYKLGSVSTSEPGKEGREILPPTSLRIGNRLHRFGELIDLNRSRAMLLPPCAEQVGDALAARVIGLERFDTLDWVAAS
jgi:hypothetical protein